MPSSVLSDDNKELNSIIEFFACTLKLNKHCSGVSQRHLNKSSSVSACIRDYFLSSYFVSGAGLNVLDTV